VGFIGGDVEAGMTLNQKRGGTALRLGKLLERMTDKVLMRSSKCLKGRRKKKTAGNIHQNGVFLCEIESFHLKLEKSFEKLYTQS
jgi:hypothetical protein